jgi:hypothetical protein
MHTSGLFVHSDNRMRIWREEDQNLVIGTLCQNADGMQVEIILMVSRIRYSHHNIGSSAGGHAVLPFSGQYSECPS